jgi:NADPH2:quinone reductase
MKAIRFHSPGDPSVIRVENVDLPPPKPNEVTVRHAHIGVNFIDTYHRSGLYPLPMPSGLGMEGAGTVTAVGSAVDGLAVGDRVAHCSGPIGAYAELHNVPAGRVVKLPKGIGTEVAAALLLKGLTVQYLFRQTYKLERGQTIVLHAAAGGTGLIACQWARHLGVTVIGTVGSDDKAALAKSRGCAHVLNSRRDNIPARVRELTGGKGVPVVYDGVGKDTFMASLDCLSPRGLMVSFGNASGPVTGVDLGVLSAKGSLYVTRPTLATYAATTEALRSMAAELFSLVESGAIVPDIGTRFPLTQAADAHRALQGRGTTGSLLLTA